MGKIRRSQIQTFVNVTPASPHSVGSAGATYALLGDGVPSAETQMNPKTTEEQYIAQDTATITVDSYAPNMPIEMTAKKRDEVFEFVDQLRLDRAILADAVTDIVNVWAYETGGPTAYPAERQLVSIAVEEFGGPGGEATKLNFTINFIGEPVAGTFNASTRTFTAS